MFTTELKRPNTAGLASYLLQSLPQVTSMSIEPFSPPYSGAAVEDLRLRLAQTRWPDEIPGSGWEYGVESDFLRQLCAYWKDHFDWKTQVQKLSVFHHYCCSLEGTKVHFIHEPGKGPAPIPLILTHGWPGSFLEMLKIIPLLTDPGRHGGDPGVSFNVVVPSLPGFGFSGRPTQPGMNTFRIADLWAALMAELGYDRFAAQGGDWGASVTTGLGFLFPDRVLGLHLNYIPGSFQPPHDLAGQDLTEEEKAFLATRAAWVDTEGAYGRIQATRPQSLAYALNDSPAGLAGWIVEKFRAWSDCEGDVERAFTRDELLTNISIYWFTQTIGSSMRLYWESRRRPLSFATGERVRTPVAVAHFPKEIPLPPRSWVERVYDVRWWTEMPKGGHFAALEQPALLAQDIRAFFRSLRGATGPIP